jgi:hypothetical protein
LMRIDRHRSEVRFNELPAETMFCAFEAEHPSHFRSDLLPHRADEHVVFLALVRVLAAV